MTIERLYQLFIASKGISTDTRKIKKNTLFFALKGSNFNGNTFAEKALELGASHAIVDEAKQQSEDSIILVDNVLACLQALATYHRQQLGIPILALTGSNGKTTTKDLIASVLSQKFKVNATLGNLNNHIGVPLTLLAMNQDTEFGVVEMGANHLEEIAFLCSIAMPDFGYITNFGKAHLEGFGSLEGVIKAKSELYAHLVERKKLIFYNADDAIQKEKAKQHQNYSFSQNKQSDTCISLLSADPLVQVQYKNQSIQSNLLGDYNFSNIAAAIAIGDYFKLSATQIKNAIEAYVPSNNRSQLIKKKTNTIILDAYNANPSSMKVALSNFSKLKKDYKIAILGDMFELGDASSKEHQEMVCYAATLDIDMIYFIGEHFMQTQIAATNILKYPKFEAFSAVFNMQNNCTYLIKGSRGMALERTLDLL